MTLLEKIRSSRTYCDGGMGTLLQARGLKPGELPELWNLTHPEEIIDIHHQYLLAGANIITANTFGANELKFGDELEDIIAAALANIRTAISRLAPAQQAHRYAAFDVGSLGKMLEPLGDMPFERAIEIFGKSIRIAAKHGADLIFIETMNDSYEAKAAVLAAKENCDLPVFITCVYDAQAKLMTGADPAAMVAMLEGLGVDALGMNCSLGPEQMLPIVPRLAAETSLPLIVNPNAGLPRTENGKTVFDVDAERFSDIMVKIVESGACLVGGCCGTTPEYIRKTVEKTSALPF
ncbi:MAG: homocysteine S-methyltransferase family protein, partial [Mailhella sp.]|nr:homocysteine S-methyltransferase family protein [Mailhella sp.]